MRTLVFLLLILTACNSNSVQKENSAKKLDSLKISNEGENPKSYESLNFALVTTSKDSSEYILIDKKMAVMFGPDSTWTAQQMKEMGEDGWNEVVADHDYYQSEAMDALENIGVDVKFFNSNKRYFKFVKNGNKAVYLDKMKMKEKWGLILFNADKDPVFWSSTMINDAIKDIYN